MSVPEANKATDPWDDVRPEDCVTANEDIWVADPNGGAQICQYKAGEEYFVLAVRARDGVLFTESETGKLGKITPSMRAKFDLSFPLRGIQIGDPFHEFFGVVALAVAVLFLVCRVNAMVFAK